jgi:GDP-D-mannose dehydratase
MLNVFTNDSRVGAILIFNYLKRLGDSTKAKTEMGWVPEYTFDTLINEMVDADCCA